MFSMNLNPAYVYALIVDALALLIGLGAVQISTGQEDLILKVVASVILVATGASVPAAREVQARVDAALATPVQNSTTPVIVVPGDPQYD
jgi:hypothetical protein